MPDVVAGRWPRNALMNGREISGKRLGLIGFGSIARETARRAGALGMSIVAHDPFVPTDAPIWGELGAGRKASTPCSPPATSSACTCR